MNLAAADRPKLQSLLQGLGDAVEALCLGGLTTATEATRQTLHISFQEASRLKLLRLGSTLRVANEELGRFTRNDEGFSRKRLIFFLNRAWLLSRGLAKALKENDDAAFQKLLWVPPSKPVKRLEVVTLGVAKKVAAGAFCSFEFRLRSVGDKDSLPAGYKLIWSCVFPVKPGASIPPEGYLHLPQKQKFTANLFLQRNCVVIENATVSTEEHGGRISLLDNSTVTEGDKFEDWEQFKSWDWAAALRRIESHRVGPFDLDTEIQEEVILEDWKLLEPVTEENQTRYPIESSEVQWSAVAANGVEGEALRKRLEELRAKKTRPPLFALLHYERCRLALQPLSLLDDKAGPTYLTLSDSKVDRAALLKSLEF
jgi:hypothetical protein